MDKWKIKKEKQQEKNLLLLNEQSLLPPTRRSRVNVTPTSLSSISDDKRNNIDTKKWSIDGLFRKFTSYLEPQTSSSSLDDSSNRTRKKIVKNKSRKNNNRSIGCYVTNDFHTSQISSNDDNDNYDELLNSYSKMRNKVKARVEAKRDRLCVDDSSGMDDSSNEDHRQHQQQSEYVVLQTNGNRNKTTAEQNNINNKRKSRTSRTERYLKRLGNNNTGTNGSNNNNCNSSGCKTNTVTLREDDTRNVEDCADFQPIDRVPCYDHVKDFTGKFILFSSPNYNKINYILIFLNRRLHKRKCLSDASLQERKSRLL